ncbi:hypothetical protein HYV73_01230 [Candidatus Uhrbacteria bacterium]|nr:hypothetical protein [Candidatus Uhrbacteria bacterium]
MIKQGPFEFHIHPRVVWNREEFKAHAPPGSIALDGMVRGGPFFDEESLYFNFDHHDGVVREVTMSTCKQVYTAITMGLMDCLTPPVRVYVNDPDQDTSLALWLLLHHKQFEGVQSIPSISRLLELTDRLDITGGSYPMNLDDALLRRHTWVFGAYSEFRRSGALAVANTAVMEANLEATFGRLDRYLMGQSEEAVLDTRHEILFDHPLFKIVDEIGGNDARYALFSKGMKAFVSLVARRPDGRFVWSIGRRSPYVRKFPVPTLYDDLTAADGIFRPQGWNGSNIVGGSDRLLGSSLDWQRIRDIVLKRIQP